MFHSLRRSALRTALTGTAIVATVEITTQLPSEGRSSLAYHSFCDTIVTPLLRRFLDPEQAHAVAVQCAKQQLAPRHHPSALEQLVDLQTTVWGITFSNPIGLAAGFDKDAQIPGPMLQLGFGSVEVGSVTPLPQPGNPTPRMYRLIPDGGIINRYGFNSRGATVVADNLKLFRYGPQQIPIEENETNNDSSQPMQQIIIHSLQLIIKTGLYLWHIVFPTPNYQAPRIVGVNLGKNKESANETMILDYQIGIRTMGEYADYLVINVSSPNTPGLRDLQRPEALQELLHAAIQERNQLSRPTVPLLVKLSPDLSNEELVDIANIVMSCGIDGLIVSNTTNARPSSLQSPHKNELGGLSGVPLKERSTECIRILYQATQGTVPIIGVGGISNAHDVMEKLKAGASLVQLYSILALEGPGVVSRMRHDLAALMRQEGFKTVMEIVGYDHEEMYWKKQQLKMEQQRILSHDVMVTGDMKTRDSAPVDKNLVQMEVEEIPIHDNEIFHDDDDNNNSKDNDERLLSEESE